MHHSLLTRRVRKTQGAGPAWSLTNSVTHASCKAILGPCCTVCVGVMEPQRAPARMKGRVEVKLSVESFVYSSDPKPQFRNCWLHLSLPTGDATCTCPQSQGAPPCQLQGKWSCCSFQQYHFSTGWLKNGKLDQRAAGPCLPCEINNW